MKHQAADGRLRDISTRLPGMKDVNPVYAIADRAVREGNAAFAADLGMTLAERYGSSAQPVWQYSSVVDHILRLLASTPGAENVQHAVRLMSAAASEPGSLDRYVASLLAASQAAEDLTPAFTRGGPRASVSQEFRMCLVHESALRGVRVLEIPGVEPLVRSPNWLHHPLGWLPLELSELEKDAPLPRFSATADSYAMPYGKPDGSTIRPGKDLSVPSAVETTVDSLRSSATAAVANWTEKSNGRVEVRSYDVDGPVTTSGMPHLMEGLGLESLKGVDRRKRLTVSSCTPQHAWRALFAAASTGGAYSWGEHGAYGRLAAWRSLAALAGTPAQASFAEVDQRVQACDWYSFEAATHWFEHVAWDIGLVAFDPERRRLAVLAATDTD